MKKSTKTKKSQKLTNLQKKALKQTERTAASFLSEEESCPRGDGFGRMC